MKHIRSSNKGVFFLENDGAPITNITDFGEPILVGSLCVDTTDGNLYIFKGVEWFPVGYVNNGTGGIVDISYIRTQPTKTALGGMPSGTIPNFPTIQNLLDTVLYPFTPPSTSLSSSSLHEKGTVVNKSMSYSITPNNATVLNRTITLNGFTQFSPIINSGTYASPSNLTWSNSPTNTVLYYTHTFNLRVNYTNYSQTNSSITVEFASPTYYGSLSLANVNETNIKALTKNIRKKANQANVSYSPILQRYIYAYPTNYGDLTSITDPNNFNVTASFNKSVISFTLPDSTIENYNVYVSNADTTQTNFKLSFNF